MMINNLDASWNKPTLSWSVSTLLFFFFFNRNFENGKVQKSSSCIAIKHHNINIETRADNVL